MREAECPWEGSSSTWARGEGTGQQQQRGREPKASSPRPSRPTPQLDRLPHWTIGEGGDVALCAAQVSQLLDPVCECVVCWCLVLPPALHRCTLTPNPPLPPTPLGIAVLLLCHQSPSHLSFTSFHEIIVALRKPALPLPPPPAFSQVHVITYTEEYVFVSFRCVEDRSGTWERDTVRAV